MDKSEFVEHLNNLDEKLGSTFIKKANILLESNYIQNGEVQSYKPAFIAEFLSESNEGHVALTSRKYLITGFIIKNWASLNSPVININHISAYQSYFERLFLMISTDNEDLINDDIFWKELAIARLQFFPVKSGVVEFYSGFGIRQGLSSNLLESIRFSCFLFQYGRKPYYEAHTHTPTLHNFSSDCWADSYCQIADMLKDNPNIHGVMRGSWFLDPEIKNISPRLSYLQDLPLKNGASTFCVGEDYSGSALAKSKTRLNLFNEGKYTPMNYLLVWPREAIISWSEKYKEASK